MKIRALKDFYSSIVNMKKDEIKEIELDNPTYEYWTDCGLIEVIPDELQPVATTTVVTDATVADVAPATPTPEAVNA